MKVDVILLSLIVWLPGALSGVVRQLDDYQNLEDEQTQPCVTYYVSGLLHVDCSYKGLSEIPGDIDPNVQVLDLSNNAYSEFPLQLKNFTQLQKLDLSGNLLTVPLPLYFEDLEQLQTLNLSNNNYEIWIGSLRRSNIKILDLSKNKIGIIDAASVTSMPSLLRLDLSENRIYDMPPRIFAAASNLERLILSRNYFSDVPSFQSSSLKSLYLSSCQITNIEARSLTGLNSLLALDLSINQIEQVPDNLVSNTLQEFDLSYNEIGTLTDNTFSSLPHLAVLNMRGNEFREVWPNSYFASNPFLREIHVKGNRWSCEGFSVNLLLTYEFLSSRVSDPNSLICYTPSNVTQMSWREAYIETWHASDDVETYTAIAVMIGIIIGIVITSCVCRSLMALNKEPVRPPPPRSAAGTTNLNGTAPQPRAEGIEIRVPLREDLPPSYDEALLMPRLDSSFHSLPDFVDVEANTNRRYRRSQSFGDLTSENRPLGDRRSVRRMVEIHIT